jgi:hypothetical protein
MTVTCTEIGSALASWPPDRLWHVFLGHGRTLQPFWSRATNVFAERLQLAAEKRDRHLGVVASAFDRMDDWRSKRVKYVRARRDEIDSAISFIRNRALDRAIASLRFAPAARNAAGALRSLLTTACHGYRDDQMPELVAAMLYGLAAVRTLFPISFDTLFGFNFPNQPGLDPLADRLHVAANAWGLGAEVSALTDDVARLWADIGSPRPWELPESVWSEEADALDARAHFAAVKAFHGRPASAYRAGG